jgi:hypothetical protein
MTKLYKVKLETISVSSSPKEEIIKAKTPEEAREKALSFCQHDLVRVLNKLRYATDYIKSITEYKKEFDANKGIKNTYGGDWAGG